LSNSISSHPNKKEILEKIVDFGFLIFFLKFGAQNQYGRVTYSSIGNVTWSKKKYACGGQKAENKLSELKNRIWGPKSI
jgi:hypothetical protein